MPVTVASLPLPVAAQTAEPATIPALLPRDLSPYGMFQSADPIVKAVLIGLAIASIVSWTVWLAKTLEILSARRRLANAAAMFGTLESLNDCRAALVDRRIQSSDAAALMSAVEAEIKLSHDVANTLGLKERVATRLQRIEAASIRRLNFGTGLLATIGATAPFVGLFGTVWGIMNSFVGISKQHTTSLAIVAPGIAEALLATALGLVAAIPAVVMYNMLQRSLTGCRAAMTDSAANLMLTVGRDIDRGCLHPEPPAA